MREWYAFACLRPGFYRHGPKAGRPYRAGTLQTHEGRIIVSDDVRLGLAAGPPGRLVRLRRRPPMSITVQDWLAAQLGEDLAQVHITNACTALTMGTSEWRRRAAIAADTTGA